MSGPGFRLADRWNRLGETVKMRKKREKMRGRHNSGLSAMRCELRTHVLQRVTPSDLIVSRMPLDIQVIPDQAVAPTARRWVKHRSGPVVPRPRVDDHFVVEPRGRGVVRHEAGVLQRTCDRKKGGV